MLVLFIAAILIGWTVVDLGLYFAICQHDQVPMRLIPCLLKSLPLLAGVPAPEAALVPVPPVVSLSATISFVAFMIPVSSVVVPTVPPTGMVS